MLESHLPPFNQNLFWKQKNTPSPKCKTARPHDLKLCPQSLCSLAKFNILNALYKFSFENFIVVFSIS